ncbi:MAG: hypothetical protein ACRDZQ_16110 [Acidimicrobiales bacterium]
MGTEVETIEVETKDCTALGDAELGEMADLCNDGPAGFDVGWLSKQPEAWVLVTQAREADRLVGFSFFTLERIGGTPSLLVGVTSVNASHHADAILAAIMGDHYHRALLAFPDEDVLVGTRMIDARGFVAFAGLEDVVPRPGHRATGEERAWGRRLAKRFGAEGRINDRAFVITGDGSPCGLLEYNQIGTGDLDPALGGLFAGLDTERRDCLVAFGWAMAEDLAAGRLGG